MQTRKRTRIVADTNILVSATISNKGAPAKIIQAWQKKKIEIIISPDILEEFRRVLFEEEIREYSSWTEDEVRQLIQDLSISGIQTKGELKLSVIKEDPTDDKWLVAAIEGEADYIVTGDVHLKNLSSYEGIKIISPAEFIKTLGVSAG